MGILLLVAESFAQVTPPRQRSELKFDSPSDIVIKDIFGRELNDVGIVLVDWEGYMANPAMRLFVTPPTNVAFPGTAVLTSSEPRLYFDVPSEAGPNGPTKTITVANVSSSAPFYLSIFPDRDTIDENHSLSIQFTDANGVQKSTTVNVHVIDQDENQPLLFKIIVDFSKDQTGFFNDPRKREIVQQAADDWAYFIDDMNLDSVFVEEELTFIWNSPGFTSGSFTTNINSYKGFLLYAYGVHNDELRAGGEASTEGGFQCSGGCGSNDGIEFPLRRSGGIEFEPQGNYNTLGWFLTSRDNDWWKASNLIDEQHDLYSIAHHEMGHALAFYFSYPIFGESKKRGDLRDPVVLAYHGSYPKIDATAHFDGEIDNLSKKGAFGFEYFGDVPKRRWIITRLDLLCMQAIGYKIRDTSAFIPLMLIDNSLSQGIVSMTYVDTLRATGGVLPYYWEIKSGVLPHGLSLNSFTGVITGTPSEVGTFNFTVSVLDYDSASSGV